MSTIRIFITATIIFLAILSAIGQNCYENTRTLGRQSYAAKHYTQAMNEYFAAYFCENLPENHDLEILIKQAQDAQLNIYKKEVAKAKEAKEKAQSAELNEIRARERAEYNAELAKKRGRRAESLRLALLADIERRKKNYSDALTLAFYGLQLSDSTNKQNAMTSFARTVRDSFIQYIPIKGSLLHFQNHDLGITTIDNNGFTFWEKDAWTSALNLPKFNQQYLLNKSTVILGMDTSNIGYIFDLKNTKNGIPLKKHTESIKWISSSSNYTISCSRDDKAAIWDKNGKFIRSFIGHKGNVYQGIITNDEKNIVTRSSDGTVIIWSIDGKILATIDKGRPYISSMAIDEKNNLILLADANGEASLWSLKGENILNLKHGKKALTKALIIGKNKEILLSLATDQSLKLWDSKGKLITSISNVAQVKYLVSQNILLTRNSKTGINFWSLDGKLIQNINDLSGSISGSDFNSKRNNLLTTNTDGFIHLRNNQGEILLKYQIPSPDSFPAAFSKSGDFIMCFNPIKSRIEIIAIPSYIYAKMQESHTKPTTFSSSIIDKYNIQFLEQ